VVEDLSDDAGVGREGQNDHGRLALGAFQADVESAIVSGIAVRVA
jgi:hypothetical protein